MKKLIMFLVTALLMVTLVAGEKEALYSYNFENGNQGWDTPPVGEEYANQWYREIAGNVWNWITNFDGNNTWFLVTAPVHHGTQISDYTFSPTLDLSGSSRVKMDLKYQFLGQGIGQCVYRTSESSEWVVIEDMPHSHFVSSATRYWNDYTVYLPIEVCVNNVQIGFFYSNENVNDFRGFAVDDIVISEFTDTEAPEVLSISGIHAVLQEEMNITLKTIDVTGTLSATGVAFINGTPYNIEMLSTSEVMEGTHIVTTFTGTLPAQSEESTGAIVFTIKDTSPAQNSVQTEQFQLSFNNTILSEDFENIAEYEKMPEGWLNIDVDGDDMEWDDAQEDYYNNTDNRVMFSSSYNGYDIDVDNYMVTPMVTMPTSSSYITYRVCASNTYNSQDHYELMVSTTGTSPENFISIFSEFLDAGNNAQGQGHGEWKLREIDLSSYAGQNIYVAFRHNDCPPGVSSGIKLDDVMIKKAGPNFIEENQEGTIPSQVKLGNNYPNPFNPSTTISFSLKVKGTVNITIFDATGKKITQLLNSKMSKGEHSVNFNATNLSAGVYYYSIRANGFIQTKKMILIK